MNTAWLSLGIVGCVLRRNNQHPTKISRTNFLLIEKLPHNVFPIISHHDQNYFLLLNIFLCLWEVSQFSDLWEFPIHII
jgi:hypothetical protein